MWKIVFVLTVLLQPISALAFTDKEARECIARMAEDLIGLKDNEIGTFIQNTIDLDTVITKGTRNRNWQETNRAKDWIFHAKSAIKNRTIPTLINLKLSMDSQSLTIKESGRYKVISIIHEGAEITVTVKPYSKGYGCLITEATAYNTSISNIVGVEIERHKNKK